MNPRRTYSTILTALFLALSFSFAGCGGGGGGAPGGGGGNPPPTGRLQGNYSFVVLVRDTSSGQVRSEMGLGAADGQGGFTISANYGVSGGGTFGPGIPAVTTYTEAADRSLSMPALGSVALQGRVADDGSIAVLSAQGGSNPATAILMRRAIAPPISDLAGVWTYIEWRHFAPPSVAQSTTAKASITATGQFFIDGPSLTYNLDGQINPLPAAFGPQQLTVQPDGWLTTSFPPGPVEGRGAVSADRNLILLGGNFSVTKHASITVLVRRGQATSAAALTGDYYEANFESSILGFVGGWGTLGLDGAGAGTWSYALNLEGAPFPPSPLNVAYGVGVDGRWDLVDTASTVGWRGAVGAGGRYAFLAGAFTPNANPGFIALVR